MEKKKKAKPMTEREKKERAKIRKDLREQGILPPKKKPLNRKVFAEQAKEALKNQDGYALNLYLHWALLEMLEKQDYSRPGAIVYSQVRGGESRTELHKRRAVRGNQRYLRGIKPKVRSSSACVLLQAAAKEELHWNRDTGGST